MNPTEVYQFVTTMIRDGAEVVAAFGLGALSCVYLLWQFGALGSKPWKRRVAELERKLDAMTGERDAAKEEKDKYKVDLALVQPQLTHERSGREKAEQERDGATAQATMFKQERDDQVKLAASATAQVAQLKSELAEATQSWAKKLAHLNKHLEEEKERVAKGEEASTDLERRLADSESDCATAYEQADKEAVKRAKAANLYSKKCAQLRKLRKHLDKVIAEGGRIWERPVAPGATPFVPLASRPCPIVTLLNLKGGVGKTTLALNLAVTLADQGKRVLLVDMDHQRSLSHMCLRTNRRHELDKQARTLQHYLLHGQRSPELFLSCAYPVNGVPNCKVVINSDPNDGVNALAGAEERLLLEWVTRVDGPSDVRMILREALHSDLLAAEFDYVFLDCPPRLGTATINALAACDFVLMPVMLDAASASNPIPHLLKELSRLRGPNLFPHLRLLGIVAN